MSSTTTRFGLKIPDGTDVVDNDLFVKGNFNILEAQAAKKTETVAAAGQQMEIVEVSFVSSGSTYVLDGDGVFAKTYTVKPTIIMGQISQQINYSDTMSYPFIPETTITLTGFRVTVKTSVTTNNFGAGTLKMKFLVFGS